MDLLSKIGENQSAKLYIQGKSPRAIRAAFDKEHEPRIAQLTEGQWVTVRGKCKGEILATVLLEDCSLID